MRTCNIFVLRFLWPDNHLNKMKVFLFLLYMWYYYKMVVFFQNLFPLIPQSFSIFYCIFQKKISIVKFRRYGYVFLPLQTYSRNFIYSGLMLWLCLYPITYSLNFNISENNPLEINISLMLMSFILNTFLLLSM